MSDMAYANYIGELANYYVLDPRIIDTHRRIEDKLWNFLELNLDWLDHENNFDEVKKDAARIGFCLFAFTTLFVPLLFILAIFPRIGLSGNRFMAFRFFAIGDFLSTNNPLVILIGSFGYIIWYF